MRTLSLPVLGILLSVIGFAQTITIPAANTNTNSARQPLGSFFGFERTELLYAQDEIGQFGTITSIAFYVNSVSSPAASTPVVIRMATTANTTVTSGTYATRSAGSTQVFSGNILSSQLIANTWVTITLDAPFVYSSNNLAIFVETNAGGTGSEGSTAKQFRRSAPVPAATRFQSWAADNSAPTTSGTTAATRTNIQLNFLQAPCSGTPAPGNTTGPSSVCSGVNFTLGLSNPPTGSSINYQWYRSTVSGSGPWTPFGGNSASITTSQTQQSWYYCEATCTTGPNTGTSSVLQVGIQPIANCYCSSINFSTVEPICLVQFAGINNSTCSAVNCSPALENFTAGTPGTVMPGQSYTIVVSGNTDGGFTNHFRAFFDWDQDGTFETSNVIGTILNTNCVGQASANITVPMNATVGTTRMRVVKNFSTSPTDPCGTYSFGQAEDYTIIVLVPTPPCNAPGTPTVSGIGPNSATVSWPAAPGATSYNFTAGTGASCPTGVNINLPNTSLNLSGLTPNTTYRVCIRTNACGGGAASDYVSTTFTTPPLPNDNCAGAITVSCNSTVTGSTLGAASDAALGSCGVGTGATPGNGIWYRLAGDGSQVTLDLCASAYDTKVHVYTGACGALTCVASNDDFCSLQSRVVFNTTAGVNYYILVNGFSTATGAFSMNISCVCGAPLGAPWTVSSIGGAVGQAIDNVCGGSIDISSNGFQPSELSDKMFFASRNLCGNQTITVKINSITNNGSAGIMFRETNDPGSKLVALRTTLGNFVFREIRSTTNGFKTSQNQTAFGHSWLRLVRSGNNITGFHSSNGVTWTQSLFATVAMNSCVEVGLFVYGNNVNSTATAAFSNVSISSGTIAPPVDAGSNDFTAVAASEFTLFPNPAQSEINVKMSDSFLGREVTIQVSNQLGQAVMVRRIGEVQNLVENLQISELPHGVYIMTLRAEGQESLSRKFVVGATRP